MSRSRLLKPGLLAAIVLVAAFLRLYRIDSLPPAAGYDQAAYGLDALQIVDGARPVFLPSNFGREALFSYLVALVYLVLGDAALSVYVTSALVGVLTVPAVYLAAEELFGSLVGLLPRHAPVVARPHNGSLAMTGPKDGAAVLRPPDGGERGGALARWGGLLAALVLAISRWHVSWSRLGMRAILVPLFAATTVWLLWRGLRTGRWWTFAACGLSLGLSLHTYQAARALPLLVVLGYGYAAWARRSFGWRDVGRLALIAVVTLAVFAPLGLYFLRHPGSAGQRIGQAAVVGGEAGVGETLRVLARQTVEALRVVFVRGDSDPRVTVLGRPALDPFLAAALVLGIVIAVLGFRQPAYALLLTWLAGLSAPAILAQYGWVTKRALGAIPAGAMLASAGCLEVWEWAAARWSRGGVRLGWALLIGGGLVYSGVQTAYGYFDLWAKDPNLFTHFEVGPSEIGRYVGALPAGERVYLSPVPVDHPSVALYSGRRPGVQGFQGRFCSVAVDRASQDTTYVIAHHDDRESLPRLSTLYPGSQAVGQGAPHYGQPFFSTLRVPAGTAPAIAPQHIPAIEWRAPDATIQLWGYDLDQASYKPGERVGLTIYWRAPEGPPAADYTVFVHLLGPDNPATGGPLWAQDDSEPCRRGYPTSSWSANEIIVDGYALEIPPNAPEDEYRIAIGLYEWQTMQRLPVLDETGQVVGDHAELLSLRVMAGP